MNSASALCNRLLGKGIEYTEACRLIGLGERVVRVQSHICLTNLYRILASVLQQPEPDKRTEYEGRSKDQRLLEQLVPFVHHRGQIRIRANKETPKN